MAGDAPERYALVVCDAQPDLLASLPQAERERLLSGVRELLGSARSAGWLTVFTGLRFPAAYEGVPPRHRLFGGLQRLNAKQGDERVHWFMEGHAGAEIEPSLGPLEGSEALAWRDRLRPGEELLTPLRAKNITKVAVVGLKTAQGVLAVCQALMDEGLLVYVVKDCVADDNAARSAAVVDHVLPQFADVLSLADFKTQISQEMMIDMFVEMKGRQRAG
mmetsp:Transcript_86221/g.268212  ORF Transcript_86221/g.268212 Transcript_86221/m.268212 type:complete len:219 (+) Transcript_86221:58-714(+)